MNALPVARSHALGAELPLFDAHVHWSVDQHAEILLDRALAILDAAGVRMALVSSTSDTATVTLYRANPRRVVPMLRPYSRRADMGAWHRDAGMPAYLAERLALGVHEGIGEFHLYGEGATSPVVRGIVAMAVARNLILHADIARAVEILFQHDAKARVLWRNGAKLYGIPDSAFTGRAPARRAE